jgi:hypothetical protein
MPRYFFHVYDDWTWSRDKKGGEFPDFGAAVQEAAEIARELLDDDEKENKPIFESRR